MTMARAFLTTYERDVAISAYIKQGFNVKKDGARALVVIGKRDNNKGTK